MTVDDDMRAAVKYYHWCGELHWATDDMKERAARQIGNIYYKVNGYFPSDRVLKEMLRPPAAGVSPDPPSGIVY